MVVKKQNFLFFCTICWKVKISNGVWCLTPLSTIFQLYRDGKKRKKIINDNEINKNNLMHVFVIRIHCFYSYSSLNKKNFVISKSSKRVCQWLETGRYFSLGTPVSSTNKTDCRDITEIFIESGVKHHNPNPNPKILKVLSLFNNFYSKNQLYKFWKPDWIF